MPASTPGSLVAKASSAASRMRRLPVGLENNVILNQEDPGGLRVACKQVADRSARGIDDAYRIAAQADYLDTSTDPPDRRPPDAFQPQGLPAFLFLGVQSNPDDTRRIEVLAGR